jgi:methyl halide transferase
MKQHWNQYWNSLDDLNKSHWEAGGSDHNLNSWYKSNPLPSKVLEIGCGTGTDSIWMAQQGSRVIATDVSDRVLHEANRRSNTAEVEIKFLNMNIVDDPINELFDLIYDRGCFHLYNQEADRIKFVQNIQKMLGTTGTWLSLCASVESWDSTQPGKSAKTAEQIIRVIEPFLRVVSVKEICLNNPPNPARAGWEIQAKPRVDPAAPWAEWMVDR